MILQGAARIVFVSEAGASKALEVRYAHYDTFVVLI